MDLWTERFSQLMIHGDASLALSVTLPTSKFCGWIEHFGEGIETNCIGCRRDAPLLPSNLPLLRSEPIFRAIAEQNNPGKILFSHSVIDFQDEGDSVIVHVESGDGRQLTYRAQYLFGADGGKTTVPKLGIEMEGPKKLRQMLSAHFKCDLSQYWDDRTCIAHFANPESGSGGRSGSMLPLGPSWGRHSEEWQMHFTTEVGAPEFSIEEAKPRVRALLKLPDLELEVIGVASWVMERVLANSYRKGRVFIGGDSAHRHPPTTGLGLNTAVQDAHNIAWKLALVLKGKASPSILDTYEIERRPVGKQITDWAFFTWKNHRVIAAAIGLQEGQLETNRLNFSALLDENSEIGRASRATLQNVVNSQVIEFGAHEMDLGLYYPEGCFSPDGTAAPPMDPTHQKYTPTTRPGHRLPHVWLERQGNTFSTHDLTGQNGDFLLITDRDGGAWVTAAKQAAETKGVGLRVAQITAPFRGVKEEEYLDPEGTWELVKGVNTGGAILVRPDNVVGWRSFGPGKPDEISAVFDKILGFSQAAVNGHSETSSAV
jgi:2,4-dichlorophenol 6-monooxygenase